jgi:rfaE bifunctional protein kinase chain/domain
MSIEQLYSGLTPLRCAKILAAASRVRIVVVGDVILDHFIWGRSTRISPEAPVPVVDIRSESYMLGGAANVARNLSSLGGRVMIFGTVGHDKSADRLCQLLIDDVINVSGLVRSAKCYTTTKTRIVVGQQQIARLDRETHGILERTVKQTLHRRLGKALARADAVIVADYSKGVITQELLDILRKGCAQKVWLSLDPKPSHSINLQGLSLLTPNRREAFQLADLPDNSKHQNPSYDTQLLRVAAKLMEALNPKVLLITLSELGLLLCIRGHQPIHIPTAAKQVFDVSGAGDTVIASFTLAIATGASPLEAAQFSNHAAGLVVGKLGTATVTPAELRRSLREARASLSDP